MFEILNGIKLESLPVVAVTMAFVLILAKPVRDVIKGTSGTDPVIDSMQAVVDAVNKNTGAMQENVALMKTNLEHFERVVHTADEIRVELIKQNARAGK